MKKFTAALLSVLLLLSVSLPVSVAADGKKMRDENLKFKDGKFTIMVYADFQDVARLKKATKNFIRRSLDKFKPDLIVLLGDNIAGYNTKTVEKSKKGIAGYMDIFEEYKIPTAIVFGNHDEEDNEMSPEEQMAFYNTYSCSVSRDQDEDLTKDLHGCGTYNLPIYSSDGKSIRFNLWFFDSGTDHEGDEDYDYDWVQDDQLEWYKNKSDELKKQNGGKPVPSFAFQHIVLPEIFKALVPAESDDPEAISKRGKYYKMPDGGTGGCPEAPCPTMDNPNDHQYDVMKAQGDCLAVITGHDHRNTFDIPYEDMHFIAVPTAGFSSYGVEQSRGARIFTIEENSPKDYTSVVYTIRESIEDAGFGEKITYHFFNQKRNAKAWFGDTWKKFTKLFKKK